MNRRSVGMVVSSCAMLLGGAAVAEEPTVILHKVVEVGDPAPGSDVSLFEGFGAHDQNPFVANAHLLAPPNIDRAGNMAFHAFLGTDGVLDPFFDNPPSALFARIDGILGPPIVAPGDPAPGSGGIFFGIVSAPFPTASGITFDATIVDPPGCGSAECLKRGVWSSRSGRLEKIVLSGERFPGIPEGFHLRVDERFGHDVPDRRSILIGGRYIRDGSTFIDSAHEGLWRNRTGAWETLAIDGLRAPGTPPGVVFGEAEPTLPYGPFIAWFPNRRGRLVFSAFLLGNDAGFPTDRSNNEGIWAEGEAGLSLVVRENDPAPAAGEGFRFVAWGTLNGWRTFHFDSSAGFGDIPPHMSDNGSVVFGARIHTPLITLGDDPTVPNNFHSIWTNRNGELEIITKGVRIGVGGNPPPGDQAPGFPAGWDFSHFIIGFINDMGTVAFSGFVDNRTVNEVQEGTNLGIWWDAGGVLTIVAGEGLPVPIPALAGASFDSVVLVRLSEDSNTLWYGGRLSGPGIDGTNNKVFVRVDPDGTHHVIMRTASPVALEDGTVRTVQDFTVGGGDHVTDTGERIFEIFFTDGSAGLFTAVVAGSSAAQPGPAGRVPDGAGDPGVPLTLSAAPGGDIRLSWAASCLSNDNDYAIYEGLLGDFGSHIPILCSTGGATTRVITPQSTSAYYLVVPRSADREGSYGTDSEGGERPQGLGACSVQEIDGCP